MPVVALLQGSEWDGSSPRAAAEALGLIGLPAAVLGPKGRALAANRLFDGFMRSAACDRGERLRFAESPTDALFAEALMRLDSAAGADAVRSFPIRARGQRPPMIVHLIPVSAAALDVFAGATALLVITPLTQPAAPAAEVLQGLFDLTPSEARVARGIGEGSTVDAIARAFGLSRETVRSQLKAVLGKAGLGRQADLVAILASVDISGG